MAPTRYRNKRDRKSNFSDREIRCLLLEIATAKSNRLPRDKYGGRRQNNSNVWATITKNVNLCNGGVIERTERGLKNKWNQLKWQASQAVKKQQMTGGALPTKDFPHLDLILSVGGNRSNVTHGSEVPGKDSFDTEWNVSTPGISAHTPWDEPIQEGNVTTEPEQAVYRSVGAPLDEPFGKKDGTEPPVHVPSDVAASTATAPRPVKDFDISWLSSSSNHHSSSSNVMNASERKGRKWQLVITPETDEEVVLFKHWMRTTIEKDIAKKKLLEVQKLKAILEVEKLKYDLGMWVPSKK
uniref:uncharacterized protein n=1 Tax=Myxine glutinosa TaxID=7769 RepID=UPI00358E6B1D